MFLTPQQLDTALIPLLDKRPNYTSLIFDYYFALYNTGCRPTELHQTDKWNRVDAQTFKLKPSKNNNDRFIKEEFLPESFKQAIDSGTGSPWGYLYWKQLYYFELWFFYQPCSVGKKSIDLYLFRHNYVKKLFAQGKTIAQITELMGWLNPLMAENYIYSQIYTP